jgi:hypothetical protein
MRWTAPGQRDLVLRPLALKPVVCAGLIVKNESAPAAMSEVDRVGCHEVVIVDTDPPIARWKSTTTISQPVHTRLHRRITAGRAG